jgi:iron complex transport system permease protein
MLLAAMGLRLVAGSSALGWPDGSLVDALHYTFFFELAPKNIILSVMDLRVVRIVIAIVVGTALATGGVSLQALLRNPLAEPFILGLSSGAAVGVMAQSYLAFSLNKHQGPAHEGALIGAMVCMAIVYITGRRHGSIDPLGLLLVGVVISTINGALIMTMRAFYIPPGQRNDVGRWMMGYLNDIVGSNSVLFITILTFAGLVLLWCFGPAMDVAGFSDVEATSLGVNLPRLRKILFAIATFLAAGAVVLAGPIAFVGLISPHLARLLVGPSHRTLLLIAALIGAMLILLADVAAVLCDKGQGLLPIGIFTSILGGPLFLWMLRPHLGRGSQ